MKTTLIVENNNQLQDFYSINLHTWVASTCIAKAEAKLAMQYLSENKDQINLIITKAKVGTERSAEAIFQYLLDNGLDIPMLVIGDSSLADSGVTHIFSALSIKEIIQYSAKELNVTAKDMAAISVPDYFEIPIQHFFTLKEPICDIYQATEDSFSLYINSLNEINHTEIKKNG